MKNIKIKLSISDYKYLCQILKEARMNHSSLDKYCLDRVVEGELKRLIAKVPKLRGKGITVSFGFAEYVIIKALIQQKLNQEMYFYDQPNAIMISSLFNRFDVEIERMRKEERDIDKALI